MKNVANSKIKVTYGNVPKAKGYQIQYSTNKNFKAAKKVTTNKISLTIGKLKKNKKYYVRIRAHRVIDGQKYYGKWSNVKSIKISK